MTVNYFFQHKNTAGLLWGPCWQLTALLSPARSDSPEEESQFPSPHRSPAGPAAPAGPRARRGLTARPQQRALSAGRAPRARLANQRSAARARANSERRGAGAAGPQRGRRERPQRCWGTAGGLCLPPLFRADFRAHTEITGHDWLNPLLCLI